MRKSGNAGLVTTTGGGANNLCHTLPVDPVTGVTRSAIIKKILAYNNTGAGVTLIFGTMDRTPAGAIWVPILPTLFAVNSFDNIWTEADIPCVEFQSNTTPTAAGRTGDIRVQHVGAGGVLIQIEVEEIAESRE